MARKTTEEKNQEILDEVQKNAAAWFGAHNDDIENMRMNKKFVYQTAWNYDDLAELNRLHKPVIEDNKIQDFVRKVIGEQRQNTPNLRVRSLNGESNQDAITLRANLVRQIAFHSNSDIAYQTAFEDMLVGSFGAMRVSTDYKDANSFDQEIYVEPIRYPDRVFFDPNSNDALKCDGNFCGYYDEMSRKEFEKRYPDVEYPESFPAQISQYFNWGNKDSIKIVEYHRKEWYSYNIYKLSDGSVVTDKEYKSYKEQLLSSSDNKDVDLESLGFPSIVAQRRTSDYKIMVYKCIAGQIIEKYEWPCEYFGLIFVPGCSYVIDGRERFLSWVQVAKDSQRFLNYIKVEVTQAIKNGRREQWIATPANVTGNEAIENMWRNPEEQQGVLLANPDPVTKQMPQQIRPSEVPPTLLGLLQQSALDIQSNLGFYEAARGATGPEISGVALQERQRTSNMSVAVFFDNLDRAVEQIGRVILSLIPKIYDTERKVTVQDAQGKSRDIVLNQQVAGAVLNNIKDGEYDVYIDAGPDFLLQREQALDFYTKIAQAYPQVFNLVADLLAENTNLEKQELLVERFKTLVPPQILAKEAGQPPPPQQPDPNQMMMQQQMQVKQQELQIKQMQTQLDYQKAVEQHKIEAARNQLDLMKMQQDTQMNALKTNAEVSKARMNYQGAVADSMAKILNAHSSIAKHNHEAAVELNDLRHPANPEGGSTLTTQSTGY